MTPTPPAATGLHVRRTMLLDLSGLILERLSNFRAWLETTNLFRESGPDNSKRTLGTTPNYHTQTSLFPFAVNVPVQCGGRLVIPGARERMR
jgi:hypothetical protein